MSNAMRFGKRVLAGAAAVALGAGVLTLAAPSASATGIANSNAYQATTTFAAGLNEGICAVTENPLTPTIDDTIVDMVSTGTLRITNTVAGASTAADDTLADTTFGYISVSGPLYIQAFTPGGSGLTSTGALSGDQRTLSFGPATGGNVDDTIVPAVVLKTTGAGAGTITFLQGTSLATATTTQVLTVNVGTTCANGTVSTTTSWVQVRDTDSAATSNVDVAAGLTRWNTSTGYVSMIIRNPYGGTVTPAAVLTATATNNVQINFGSAPTALSTSTATSTTAATRLFVTQGPANKNAAVTTTITFTAGGSTIATKTIKFTGDAAKINVTDVAVKPTGSLITDDDTAFYYTITDAAGNQLAQWGTGTGKVPTAVAATLTNQIQDIGGTGGPSATADSPGNWTCGPTTGSSKVTVGVASYAGTAITAQIDAGCAGGVSTWTAKLDKSKYNEGEIAVLTITAKDSTGAPVNDFATLGAGATAVGLGLTSVANPGSNNISGTFFGGSKSLSYLVQPLQVGQKFIKSNMIVSLPAYVSAVQGSSATVPYEIGEGGGATKTIVIVGERGTVSGKPGIIVDGSTTGFDVGSKMVPSVRFPGQSEYTAGSARPTTSAVGDFTWQRKTGKKIYVFFTNEAGDVKSNRIIIAAN